MTEGGEPVEPRSSHEQLAVWEAAVSTAESEQDRRAMSEQLADPLLASVAWTNPPPSVAAATATARAGRVTRG